MNTPVKFVKLHPNAKAPVKATEGAACFDLFACNGELGNASSMPLIDTLIIGTGIAVEVPEGHVMLLFSRSGQGFTYDIRLANCVGVIDSDYRGEVKVKLRRDVLQREAPNSPFDVKTGDRIVQALIIPTPSFEFIEVTNIEDLTETDRGTGGLGSTGQ